MTSEKKIELVKEKQKVDNMLCDIQEFVRKYYSEEYSDMKVVALSVRMVPYDYFNAKTTAFINAETVLTVEEPSYNPPRFA